MWEIKVNCPERNKGEIMEIMNEQVHPDMSFHVGHFQVKVNDGDPIGSGANEILRAEGSERRARIIVMEDRTIAGDVWTPQEAADAVGRLELDEDGNFFDPFQEEAILDLLADIDIDDQQAIDAAISALPEILA